MFSPLSRGYGTWTGNYDPYADEGADSDSLPEIEEPHRHGITVGFISRTPSATAISPPFRINSSHARGESHPGSANRTREATLSGRKSGVRRELREQSSLGECSRENSDMQMNLPKTYLTKKGALVLFSAPENELDSKTLQSDSKPRFRVSRKQVDTIDTSLKLGTMDKLVMSVLDFGEDELEDEKSSVQEEKEKLFMKFLNKVDEKDVDQRSQPGGDVGHYLKDLKHTTSLQMGLTGDTTLPRSREALELRAILRGLQTDQWPCTYKQDGPTFKQPSPLAYQYSRPPSHLHHPPRNQYQRILSSKKLEDSVQSLKSYLGRSLDSQEEFPVPLLTRRRAKRDTESARRKYERDKTDDDLRKQWSQRPHTNTPTQGEVKVVTIATDDEELDEEEHMVDGKSTSRQSRDTGYHSASQGDNCSFILGPRDWTPVQSQRPTEEMSHPRTPTVDLKMMVDKGSTEVDEGEGSVDDGLDGEGIVVGLAQGSDDSDVDIIYSTGSHIGVPDNTLDTVEGFHSNDISVQTHSIKSVSPDNLLLNHDTQHSNENFQQEVSNAIISQSIESDKTNDQIYNTCKNVLATSCDDVFDEPEFIASDGESINDIEEVENHLKEQSNEQVTRTETASISRQKTSGSASSQKHSRSWTPSSMHSTAHDDDQSSVTILPHDQDLISVDVKSSAMSQPTTVPDLDITQENDNQSQITDLLAPTTEVKDTESVITGDDATSLAMSMGEDTTSVIQQLRDIHGEDEESRDKLGEITDPRLPRDDRGKIEMIDSEELKNLHFTKTSTPFPPPTPTKSVNESLASRNNSVSLAKDEPSCSNILNDRFTVDLLTRSQSPVPVNQNSVSQICDKNDEDILVDQTVDSDQWPSLSRTSPMGGFSSLSTESVERSESPKLEVRHEAAEIKGIHEEIAERIARSKLEATTLENESSVSKDTGISSSNIPIPTPDPELSHVSECEKSVQNSSQDVLVKGDKSTNSLETSKEIPHPTTPRSTEIATEEKLSPRPKSESSSKLGETIEEDVDPETLVSVTDPGKKKIELPTIPGYLKPKQSTKSQPRKDQKKKGKKTSSQKSDKQTGSTKSGKSEEKDDEITQIIKKKVTLPPEKEYSVIPDFVGEALKRSKERSQQQLEEEFREKNEMIGQELKMDTLFEGQEGMTAEELELAKKALKEKEEMTKEKLREKQQKRVEDKVRKSGGSSSVKSKKSKGVPKDNLQLEKERLKQLKEQEKQQRLMEMKAIEEKIAAASDTMSLEEKKFKDKLQEVQMELERIEREAAMADQTEQDVRNALKEDRLRRLEEKAKQKKEDLARRRQQLYEKKQMEKQRKEEALQRERQKIMMLMDEEERKRRQEEARLRQEEEEKEEQRRQREEEEELARMEQEEEERRRQLEEDIEQDQLRRIQEEQDALRIQQETIAAQKEALLEENRKKRELQALEEQRQKEELDRIQQEEMRKMAEERARMQELQKLEEDVRDKMRQEMEMKKEQAIKRREVNLEAKSNLNKMRHSQGITRSWVFSYFVDWPWETYLRPMAKDDDKKGRLGKSKGKKGKRN